jgi:hypothetical protein
MEISSFKKYSNVISLGYICNVYSLLSQVNRNQAKQHKAFDNIATPMWAVYELFNNDFADFMKLENLAEKSLFTNNDKKFWIDTKYYIRFLLLQDYAKMKARMQLQIDNLLNVCKTDNGEFLFIRYEELNSYSKDGDRISFPEYTDKYAKTELEYCVMLSDLFKVKYPTLKFKILLMSANDNFVDQEHNIVGIKSPIIDYRDSDVSKQMYDLIKSHESFLHLHL